MIFALLLLVSADDAWSWPITTEYGVTASFGEYRGQRFHMGLDFSTADQEGQPIKAARAGSVYRVRANTNGYGRVIYIKHKSGHSTVYAHLAAFGKSLSEAITSAGKDPSAWFGNLEINHAVSAEEILAFSGESGAGSPHFHFEVRDPAGRPLNPHDLNFPELPFAGNKARIKGLYLLPLDSDSEVNGQPLPFHVGPGVKRVSARGRIGVQVFAYISGNRASRLGCRGIRVYQDDRLIGEWQPRRLHFDDNGNGDMVHDPAFSGFGPTRYSYCFDNRSQYLPKLSNFKQTDVLVVGKPTRLRVEAQNLAGDWNSLSIDLDGSALTYPQQSFAKMPTQATTLATRLYADRLYITPEKDGTLQTPESLLGVGSGDRQVLQPVRGKPMSSLVWRTKTGTVKRSYGALPKSTTFRYQLQDWLITAKDAAEMPPVAVLLEPPDRKIRKQVLEYESPVLSFGRPGLPSPGFSIHYNSGTLAKPEQLGLYRWSFIKNNWSYFGKVQKSLPLDYLTCLVVARDMSPPSIGRPKRHPYFTGARVVIPVRDKGSGLDQKDMSLQGPNGSIPVEYDPGRSWIILPKGEKKGPWKVEIVDRAGHATSAAGLRP